MVDISKKVASADPKPVEAGSIDATLADRFIQVDKKHRIDSGPSKKKAIATEEILSDEVTARHYKVGKLDAEGKEIVLGEEFAYLDFKGPRFFYIYRLTDVKTKKGVRQIYQKIGGEYATADEAKLQLEKLTAK